MGTIGFYSSGYLRLGSSTYADTSLNGQLKHLFLGYDKAFFLDEGYCAGCNTSEKYRIANWFAETAGVALFPRLVGPFGQLHSDFRWLLDNKRDHVLAVLHKNWKQYSKMVSTSASDQVVSTLGDCQFPCTSGKSTALKSTYLPLPTLTEKAEKFCDAYQCSFLRLPHGDPEDWKFLGRMGVMVDEGLDFYLWILSQKGFKTKVDKSKKLYLEIQSRIFSPAEKERVQ